MKRSLTQDEIEQAKRIASTYITQRSIIHFPYRAKRFVNHNEDADNRYAEDYYTISFEIVGKSVNEEGELIHRLEVIHII